MSATPPVIVHRLINKIRTNLLLRTRSGMGPRLSKSTTINSVSLICSSRRRQNERDVAADEGLQGSTCSNRKAFCICGVKWLDGTCIEIAYSNKAPSNSATSPTMATGADKPYSIDMVIFRVLRRGCARTLLIDVILFG